MNRRERVTKRMYKNMALYFIYYFQENLDPFSPFFWTVWFIGSQVKAWNIIVVISLSFAEVLVERLGAYEEMK